MSIAEILTGSFHSRQGMMGWAYPFLRLGIYEDLRNRIRSKTEQYLCLVAVVVKDNQSIEELSTVENEDLVGTVEMSVRSLNPWQLDNFEYAYLSNLAVDINYRRLGVAQQFLNCCEQQALEWGFGDLYLHVLENNHSARRLYYRAGYRLHEVEWTWGSLLLGQPRKLFLRKSFSRKI
ncbi:MAG: GNAT family N-acetyltransferase [Microcoleaceae cyanobacterium]